MITLRLYYTHFYTHCFYFGLIFNFLASLCIVTHHILVYNWIYSMF